MKLLTTRFERWVRFLVLIAAAQALPARAAEPGPNDAPRSHDPRLVIERFAGQPDIVHPVSMAFDGRGRLLVIESHTHFRPANYDGPKHDRIRALEDTDGDGKADRFTTFFEGTTATMDIALHPDGSVYVATRNEVLRLRDADGDGKADEQERIVFLDTKGNYPHNGLSGLAFDSKGNLYFGMGENLGAGYKLVGADGEAIADEGEGGNVFWCTALGKKLRRVATGFWNPFGVERDIFGRIFAVDNDPDAMPPCRLLHVVEGGDFGYQFRYGRSGRHPFQSWNGQLAGTLPMVSGTGEGPCEVLSYESDGLPAEFQGDLLVTSWADHRVERYVLAEKGASVVAERKPFVQGGADFRPVGLAVAPDGSLFVSDWVLRDYNLHNRGAVWHIRLKDAPRGSRPCEPREALFSRHRPLREAAARQLAKQGEEGRRFLRQQLGHADVRVRATALAALVDEADPQVDLAAVASSDPSVPLRAWVVRAQVERGVDASRFLEPKNAPAVRMEAIASLKGLDARPRLLAVLVDDDPFLRHAAVQQLARRPDLLADRNGSSMLDPRQRLGLLLAHRASGRPGAVGHVPQFLADPDPEVRFLAAKWLADQQLTEHRPLLVEAMKDPQLSLRLYFAYASALARIDRQDVSEGKMADFFLARLKDRQSSTALRVAALQLLPASHKPLTLDVLNDLLRQDDAALQRETVRVMSEHPDPRRVPALLEVARQVRYPESVRAEALVGIAERSSEHLDDLLELTRSKRPSVRAEALRALAGTPLSPSQRAGLEELARRHPETGDLAARVLGKPFHMNRPRLEDLDSWLKRLEGLADPAAGRRVFFHTRLAHCSRCHRVDGRGQDVGPDLSGIGRTERRQLLGSILQPSSSVAPHYQVWSIATQDGKVHTGMLIRTYLDEYTYVDGKGLPFKLITRDIAETAPLPRSIMPDGLVDLLTDQELRDLLTYLAERR